MINFENTNNHKKSIHRKIYFDCTLTFHSGLNTGIQRVVRNIVKNICINSNHSEYETTPVIFFKNKYYEIPPHVILRKPPITAKMGKKIKSIFESIKKYILIFKFKNKANSNFESESKSIKIDSNSNDNNRTLGSVEKFLKFIFSFIKSTRVLFNLYTLNSKEITFDQDKTLVLIDAFWCFNLYNDIINIKSKGTKIVTVIYDLIPINYPELCDEETTLYFNKALPSILENTDVFICISNTVATDLSNYINLKYPHLKSKSQIEYFYLGADFSPDSNFNNKQHLQNYKNHIYFNVLNNCWLTIGTIEPRKNHTYILDGFEEYWKNGGSDCLLIIGSIGWKCDNILQRIQNHDLFNKKIFFRYDMDDTELGFCYSKSKGIIFASYVEGFGLPLVEAMNKSKLILCSDIPIFREVGQDYPKYFNLNNPIHLTSLLLESNSNFDKSKSSEITNRKQENATTWLTWKQSANHFLEIIIKYL